VILQAAAAAAKEPDFTMYLGSAVFLVGLAWAVTRWIGRTIKEDLDPGMAGRMRSSMAIQADLVGPALVKEALAKGLVTAQQLATMSPTERQYLFATLKPKLEAADATPGAPVVLTSQALPLKPTIPSAPVNAPQLRSTQAIVAIPGKPMSMPPLTPEQLAALGPLGAAPPAQAPSPMNAAPFGDDSLSESESLHVHCPCCGTLLPLPVSPPHVAFCAKCGAKTAVRTEEYGRMIINTAPPGVTRRPIG